MDVSIVAAIGSFAVSERVLKPKASVLVILGCVLIYDLTTKTHDVSSLRVYRGPALLAFSLMMCAYSLRTWRRNGVACDELLFLPGTPHGQTHGIDAPLVYEADTPTVAAAPPLVADPLNEGDAAAGLARRRSESEEMAPLATTAVTSGSLLELAEQRNQQEPAILPQVSWQEDDDGSEGSADGSDDGGGYTGPLCRQPSRRAAVTQSDDPEQQPHHSTTGAERFRENHPRLTRIGTFFFFRSSTSSTQNATYAPSGPAVFGAALDLSMPVGFNFHLFIEAYNRIGDDGGGGSEMTAKILPLIFLSVLIIRSFIPPGKRKRFWSTVKFAAMAPFHKVRFRDAFIGDVITSLVRPCQDILFALSYYATVVYGTIIGSYGLAEAGKILEQSWFLHNVVLPSCALLPLWWKFLQTLRQAYDTGRRWPFYGDSFKYLSAAMVIVYAMTHPEDRRSPWWIISFVLCTLYQICWDTIVDWQLFVIVPKAEQSEWSFWTRISSLEPSSTVLLTLHMYITQPISEAFRRIPHLDQIELRPKRLYKTESFYYRCFILNSFLRFTWMLCFIPAYHLTGDSKMATFSSDVNSYIGVLLPVAEILRRCHWGFLKVEMETIKMMDQDVLYSQVKGSEEMEETENSEHGAKPASGLVAILPTWLDVQQKQQHTAATSSHRNRCAQLCSDDFLHRLFVLELGLWVASFVGFGFFMTY